MSAALHPEHLADLRRSGLTDETIRAAGIYTVPPDRLERLCRQWGKLAKGVVNAYAIPYPGHDGHERYRVFREEGQYGPKYLQLPGSQNHLYLLPGLDLTGDAPLTITEGEKKALALWQADYQVVGLGGIWAWCMGGEGYQKPGEHRVIADMDKVNWRRPVTIIFDSDGHDNPMLRLGAYRLARELSRRGGKVSILFVPQEEAHP
jgi:hypothetical protein